MNITQMTVLEARNALFDSKRAFMDAPITRRTCDGLHEYYQENREINERFSKIFVDESLKHFGTKHWEGVGNRAVAEFPIAQKAIEEFYQFIALHTHSESVTLSEESCPTTP